MIYVIWLHISAGDAREGREREREANERERKGGVVIDS